MRKVAAVLMAVMIVLAGCSGGGGGTATESPAAESGGGDTPADDASSSGTPADSGGSEGTPMKDGEMKSTPAPGDSGDMDSGDSSDDTMDSGDSSDSDSSNEDSSTGDSGSDGSQPPAREVLSGLQGGTGLSNASQVDMTLFNGSKTTSLLIKNDTKAGKELIRLTRPSGDSTTLYTTEDYAAFRNETSGETRYGKPDGAVGTGFAFSAAFLAFAGFAFVNVVEWEQAGTTTVNGENAFVYEANSLNTTALNQNQNQSQMSLNPSFDQDAVQSVDGKMVITKNGFQTLNVKIKTQKGTFGSELSFDYGDVSISKPGWVDESKAP